MGSTEDRPGGMTPAPGDPAQTYEDYFVRYQFRPWAGELLARAEPVAGERVLDVACGTGVVARTAARDVPGLGRVAGLDPSPAMLAVARAASAAEGLDIEWVEGSAGELPFPDEAFDLVVIQQGLQFVPDKVAAVGEFLRVLRPGGRVVSATWMSLDHHPLRRALAGAIERHVGRPVMGLPFSFGERDALAALFGGAGFDPVTTERVERAVRYPDPSRWVELTVMSAAAAVPELGAMGVAARAAMVAAVRDELAGPLRDATEGGEVVVETLARVVTARRPG